MTALASRLEWGLVPAVPVPFRARTIDENAQRMYARAMAGRRIAGVAVWAHTGRGPHLSAGERRVVLGAWRAELPRKVIVAGVDSLALAREAQALGADALLAFPRGEDPVGYHAALAEVLPVIAFWLYRAAGGVAYDDATLDGILELPGVLGIKVATLDSVVTFQRLARLVERHPGRLLVTGEDRFLGDSFRLGARAALVGMGAALTDLQADLIAAWHVRDLERFAALSARLDAFAAVTFADPVEGYVRRMLWAAAAENLLPADCCDDPWGPPPAAGERERVEAAVRLARAPRA